MAAQIGLLLENPAALAELVDLNDKSNVAPMIWNLNIGFMVTLGVIVSLRIATRAFIVGQLFLDDLLIVAATLFTMGISATSIIAIYYGLGQHIWNLPPPLENIFIDLKMFVQLMFVANIFYACAICFTKVSIIVSYLRVFPHTCLRRGLYVTAAIICGLWISAIFTTIFQCDPVAAAWDITVTGHCIRFIDFLYASAAITIATDLIVTLAPIPFFWLLNLPTTQKLIVSFLFLVGLVACVSSMIRITFLHGIGGIDLTFNIVASLNLSVIECSLGIICVSVPPLRPLFSRLLPSIMKPYASEHSTEATDLGKKSRMRSPSPSPSPIPTPPPRARTWEEIAEEREKEMDKQLEEYEQFDLAHRRGLQHYDEEAEVGIAK